MTPFPSGRGVLSEGHGRSSRPRPFHHRSPSPSLSPEGRGAIQRPVPLHLFRYDSFSLRERAGVRADSGHRSSSMSTADGLSPSLSPEGRGAIRGHVPLHLFRYDSLSLRERAGVRAGSGHQNGSMSTAGGPSPSLSPEGRGAIRGHVPLHLFRYDSLSLRERAGVRAGSGHQSGSMSTAGSPSPSLFPEGRGVIQGTYHSIFFGIAPSLLERAGMRAGSGHRSRDLSIAVTPRPASP
jgi:hypothetical protein